MEGQIRSVVFEAPGGPEVLHIAHLPREKRVDPQHVRVRIKAAGINRAELMQRQGSYPAPPGISPHLGLEAAGTILEVGSKVERWSVGQRVMLLANGGAYSEEIVMQEGMLLPIPEGWTDTEAAAFMEGTLTAYLNIFQLGGIEDAQTQQLKASATVLIHGGGSSVGTQGILLCKAKGIRTIVTAGSEDKCRQCLELGADAAINYKQQAFEEAVIQLTDSRGVDMVLDNVGGSYLARDVTCMARDAHLVFIGLMGGNTIVKQIRLGDTFVLDGDKQSCMPMCDVQFIRCSLGCTGNMRQRERLVLTCPWLRLGTGTGREGSVDLGRVLANRLSIIGSTLRSRTDAFKIKLIADFQAQFGQAMQDGLIKPVIHRTYPLEQAGDAHRCMQAGENFGKIVLLTDG